MSLPVPTNPVELSAFRRRARRLVHTVSDLVRHGLHTCAAFQAHVDADRPARDNRWDHFVDICLRQVLARDPPPPRTMRLTFRGSSQQARCHSGYTCSTDYSDVYKMISGSSRTRSAGGPRWGRQRVGRGMQHRARTYFRGLRPQASCLCRSCPLGPITTTIPVTITSSTTPWGSP